MTEANAIRTFAPQLEAIFDEAGTTPVFIAHDERPGVAMPAVMFDQIIADSVVDIETIKHERIARPDGKPEVVVMLEATYAELLDAAQTATPIASSDIAAAFDI
jgi:hypothetical protein